MFYSRIIKTYFIDKLVVVDHHGHFICVYFGYSWFFHDVTICELVCLMLVGGVTSPTQNEYFES
jgi:hypothetical protein